MSFSFLVWTEELNIEWVVFDNRIPRMPSQFVKSDARNNGSWMIRIFGEANDVPIGQAAAVRAARVI